MIKACAYCGKDFEARDDRSKYCSVKCRNKRNYTVREVQQRQRETFVREW